MLDNRIRRWIDPPLRRIADRLAGRVAADTITVVACGCGLAAAGAAVGGAFSLGLGLFLAGRMLDGLDGAVAAKTARTDRGGFLDIVLDFVVYAAIPLAFALHDPARNALAAAALLAAIVLNGSAFFAYAILAERRGETTSEQGDKSLYYVAGLAEGAETIAFYALFFLWPAGFVVTAAIFAMLCFVSGLARIALAWRAFK